MVAGWQDERTRYECVISSEVIREATLGDMEMSRRRFEALRGLMRIAVDESAREQARSLLASGILPARAAADALHVVVASRHRIKILLTWNCRHLANPHLTGRLRGFLHEHGLVMPEICTPIELMGD